jgi:hypothetical protein
MSKGQVFTPATARKILQEIDKGPQRNPRNKTRRDLPTPQYFRNNASEAVPAWGVMRVSDIVEHNGLIMFEIEKPDDTVGLFVFNTGHEVAAKSGSTYDVGLCQQGPYFKAIYDTGTPSNGDIYGVDGWELSESGDRVLQVDVFGVVDATEKTILCEKQKGGSATLFEVAMTQTGGVQGTTTVAPTWSYTVDDVDGNELETVYDPAVSGYWVRHIGQMIAATRGIASYDSSDNLKVLWCNEQTVTEVCS